MSALSAWHETKRLLSSGEAEEQRAYLEAVLAGLQPAALLEHLGSFRGMDTFEEPLGCEPDEAEEFLAKLDELRQPTYRPDETRAEMQRQVSEALTAMRKLPWTGDHLYGDALDDASLVLRAVLAGKKMPVLERFRCPSLTGNDVGAGRLRCTLQLPHEGKHQAVGATWTDEQSINPPKNYDDPVQDCAAIKIPRPGVTYRCDKSKGHSGQHADSTAQKAWNVEPTSDPAFEPPKSSRCGSSVEYSTAGESATLYCQLLEGHDGAHLSPTGMTWTAGVNVRTGNPDPINRPLIELSGEQLDDLATEVFGDGECGAVNPNPVRHGKSICVRAKQHGGLHRDADGIRWEK